MNLKKSVLWAAVAGALSAPAAAQDVYLVARAFTKTLPDGVTVTMWGYAQDADGNFNTTEDQGPASAPGPLIVVAHDDPSLTIHLRNELDVNTSLFIPGQIAQGAEPAFFTDPQGRQRVRSFTQETAPGQERSYTWPNLRPGTYAYQTGTHPQVQVQMGLYGPAKKDAGAGEAYPGVGYDTQLVLLYSEIDPTLHEAVDPVDPDTAPTYGTPAYPSTINYSPRYFLVNGEPHTSAPPTIDAGSRGGQTLLRFINMGLRTHTPVLQGADLRIVAEDGNLYPHPRQQYSVMLPAGATRDALFMPTADGTYAIYDRMLNPGMLSYLEVATSTAPEAVNDAYSTAEDGALSVAAPGVLGNDSNPEGGALTAVLVNDVTHGNLTLNPDGSFDYTPAADFSGTDGFSYRADGTRPSNVASVTISVTPANDPPTGAPDHASTQQGVPIIIQVLANDTDPDGDALSVTNLANLTGGGSVRLVDDDRAVEYTPGADTGTASFSYTPFDGQLEGAAVTVTIEVVPATPSNVAPVAVDDSAQARRNQSITIAVLTNDTDVDDNIDPASVTITTDPNMGGTAVVDADGVVTYTPATNFRGTDTFAYTVSDGAGAVSNQATVRVNVR
ncbi:MAG: Ig-like domain-containing protein [Gammaproteobacteria bacterium]|nr:Ig-like domain-containing protein [Gammaproteobacteria bacterium]